MPAAGLSPLRVAPEDVNADEAGELVKNLGVHNQAKGLLQAVAKQMPKDLRVAMGREEHRQRSKYLDADEVNQRGLEAVGEKGDRSALVRVLGARVRSAKGNAFDGMVIVLYETPSGRTARCAILYNENTFPKSVAAFDRATREGKIDLPGELTDAASLRKALESSQRENARLAQIAYDRSGEHDDDLLHERIAGGLGKAPTDEDPAPPAAEEVTLPEGVEAGDPGYPVDDEGNLLVLPDSVRQSLIVSAERDAAAAQQVAEAEKAREDAEATAAEQLKVANEAIEQLQEEANETATSTEGVVWPESLDEVELPAGNSQQLIAALPHYSTLVVAALAERGEAKGTREAAVAELETRSDKPAPAAE